MFFYEGEQDIMNQYLFTSESITPGHPDKICDLIADTILDAALAVDKTSKMAVECTIKDDLILIYGEASTKANLDYTKIALETIAGIGYLEKYQVIEKVSQQSSEIHQAVTRDNEIKAGDQGIMFGFACDETKQLMPLSIHYAHKLSHKLYQLFKTQTKPVLKPDGKTQVTVAYVDDKISHLDTIVISAQHYPDITQEFLEEYITNYVIKPVIDPKYLTKETKIYINPSGSFTIGGPFGDSGTTGRKIVVDTYGGHGRIGGGCLSSKDPSKVDRSAAYYARYVAKNLVAAQLVKKIEIQVAYAIGMSQPISIHLNTFNTGVVSDTKLLEIINQNFDFSVNNIIASLDLCRPIYAKTANFGHFGREDVIFPWEELIELKVD